MYLTGEPNGELYFLYIKRQIVSKRCELFFFRFNWCYPYSLHVPLRPCSAIEMFNFFSFSYILMGSAVFFQMIVYYGFDFFNEIN